MDISEFNYYNNLKNRLAKVALEIKTTEQEYLQNMKNLPQLLNDNDVATVSDLALVYHQGNDDQVAEEIKMALEHHDRNYLLKHVTWFSDPTATNLAALTSEQKQVEAELADAVSFYKSFVLPIIQKMKKNRLIRIDEIKSDGGSCDTIIKIDYFSTIDDFREDFQGADFVTSVIEDLLERHASLHILITNNQNPNPYDVTVTPKTDVR
ncbi:hypothetical protein [Fructilactobacillus florum]|uniref:hypothetical protein n=1 Tax=Fructilactobacillus florum TaxID=640331 RepID=UPI00028CD634|nr:hypothetical protein [Fructilactobacillus florum]EKK20236.1 hypothetical protein B807_1046 [Fructilactobacillus florum 2F]